MRHLVTFLILGTCWVITQSTLLEEKIFIFQKPGDENKTLLAVTWSHEGDEEKPVNCEVFSDPQLIEEVVKASDVELIRKPSDQDMEDIIGECTEIARRKRRDSPSIKRRSLSWRRNRRFNSRGGRRMDSGGSRNSNSFSEDEARNDSFDEGNQNSETTTEGISTEGYDGLPVIFPGTKWCGAGDIAKNFDDLGLHQDTDRCCRAHDLCNDTLAPGETKNELTNKSPFTKLSCQCDDDFYNCLDRINSITSNTVGNMYFNLLRRECFKEDYPLTKKCKKYKTFLKLICIEYERDKKAKKVFQWVSAKKYKKIPFPGPLTITLPF